MEWKSPKWFPFLRQIQKKITEKLWQSILDRHLIFQRFINIEVKVEMLKYLIDTNVIIDFWRGDLFFKNFTFGKNTSISTIVLAELYCGAEKSKNPAKERKRIEKFIKDFDIEIINVDTDTAKIYGVLRSSLEKNGIRLEDFDLIIASTALQNNMTLVTKNIKHFERLLNLDILKPL